MNRALPALFLLALSLSSCDGQDDGGRLVGELMSDRVEVTSESNEPLIEIAVAEGDSVEAGQPLFRHEPARANAKLAEAGAALAQAQARLDELVRGPRSEQVAAARAAVDGAKQDLGFRQAEFERAKQVFERNLSSEERLDRARSNLDAARANLDLLQAQLAEKLTGTTLEELAQAEQAVKQAQARRDAAVIDVERQTVNAPVDGVVDSRLYEVGERPSAGKPVLVLLPGSQPYARIYVPQDLRVHVAPGSAAKVHIDGLDEPLDGRVRWVASEAAFTPYYALTERDRGRLSFVAKVDIIEARERLPDGMPAEVSLPGITDSDAQ